MRNRENDLRALSAAQFAVWELHLYLDTHPADLQTLKLFKQYNDKYKLLKKDFEEKYGALTTADAQGVEWLKNPWPWDVEGRDC